MSGTRARTQRKARRLAIATEEIQWGLSPCVCQNDQASIDWARQKTHDGVIEAAGASRRSGVTWHVWTGARALAAWDEYARDTRLEETSAAWDMAAYRNYLVEHGDKAALVIAKVDVAVPRALVGPS